MPFPSHGRHSPPQHSRRPKGSGRVSSSLHGGSSAPSCRGGKQNLLHMLMFETHESHGASASELHASVKPRATNVACAALASVTRFEQSLDQMASRDPFQLKLLCDHKKAGVRKLLRKEKKKTLSSPTHITQNASISSSNSGGSTQPPKIHPRQPSYRKLLDLPVVWI